MSLLDGPLSVFLLIVVFCCPIIPAGGWCWLKCIECCLGCLGAIVRKVRRYAYVPMYLSLLLLLIGGLWTVVADFANSDRTGEQKNAFVLFMINALLSLCTTALSVYGTYKVLKGKAEVFELNGERQVRGFERQGFVYKLQEQRERTVYIIALPSFYCLMCFLSSQQLLTKVLNTVDEHWEWDGHPFKSDKEREEFTLDMVEFFLGAADVFEAFAFTFFGMLTMESLRRSALLQRGMREERLQRCIQRWTMSPIYMFCLVLCVESAYSLLVVFARYFHLSQILPPSLEFISDFFKKREHFTADAFFTLESVFSTLAIMALFSIEHVFHEELLSVQFVSDFEHLKKFKSLSNLKFWGVKLFVTAEFSLDCCMFILHWMHYSKVQERLIYVTILGSLCFLIAILHIFAYAPYGRWIEEEKPHGLIEEKEATETVVRLPTLESGCPTPMSDISAGLSMPEINLAQPIATQSDPSEHPISFSSTQAVR